MRARGESVTEDSRERYNPTGCMQWWGTHYQIRGLVGNMFLETSFTTRSHQRFGLESVPCHIQNAHSNVSPTPSKQWDVFVRDLRRLTADSRATDDTGVVVKQH